MARPLQTEFETSPSFRGPHLELVSQVQEDGALYYWLRQQRDAAGAVIVPTDGERFLLVRQFRVATRLWHWQFPRGFSDEEDRGDGEVTARRELDEEVGLSRAVLRKVGSVFPDPGILSARALVFEAVVSSAALDEACAEWSAETHADERMAEVQAFTAEQWACLVREGAVDDALTLAAYALYRAQAAR